MKEPNHFALQGAVVLPDRVVEDATLLIRDGRIVSAGTGAAVPDGVPTVTVNEGWIAPGYVDLHVHGGGGADFMDGTEDAVRTACRTHIRHGTTTIFPTTTTGATGQLRRMIDASTAVRDGWTPADGARIGGVHFYGPYFAPSKLGCHAAEGRRDPTPAEYEDFLSRDIVRIATCAAELPGAEEFYAAARRHGCLVTCGHSEASWAEMAAGFRAGLRHVDHFWCAMSSVASLRPRFGFPMQASMEEFVLATPEMSTEVIADGCHLAPELLSFAHRMIGPERLCLVTDASRAVDCPPGRYRFGPEEDGTWIESDGKVGRMPDGSSLASSVMGMDMMVRTMAAACDAPLPDIIRMATLTTAERVGIADDCGSLEPGKRADVLVLSPELEVRRVFVGGVEVRTGDGLHQLTT